MRVSRSEITSISSAQWRDAPADLREPRVVGRMGNSPEVGHPWFESTRFSHSQDAHCRACGTPMRKLAVIAPRYPTLLERILMGITCIGFCQGNTPENVHNCHRFCIANKQSLPSRDETKQLAP